MAALDLRDVETYGHSKTVARYSHILAEAAGIREPAHAGPHPQGALLHDAGKMAIPDSILKKPGPLAPKEWDVIRRHPALGYGRCGTSSSSARSATSSSATMSATTARATRKAEGRGHPLEARIFAVADTVDAVTSHRPIARPGTSGPPAASSKSTPAASSIQGSSTSSAAWTWPSGRRSASRRPGSCRRSTSSGSPSSASSAPPYSSHRGAAQATVMTTCPRLCPCST
ncbi:MAG: HD domain-containing protein [Ignavibacteriales bacterium]|nr:HD domain-containing protein [Ignavibacteriales bacterium]